MLRDALWRAGLSPQYLARRPHAGAGRYAKRPASHREGKIDEAGYVIDGKSALELLKLLGKWTGPGGLLPTASSTTNPCGNRFRSRLQAPTSPQALSFPTGSGILGPRREEAP